MKTRTDLRHFSVAFALAGLLHVAAATALLSGTGTGGGGLGGGPGSGMGSGASPGAGLRFSLGGGQGGVGRTTTSQREAGMAAGEKRGPAPELRRAAAHAPAEPKPAEPFPIRRPRVDEAKAAVAPSTADETAVPQPPAPQPAASRASSTLARQAAAPLVRPLSSTLPQATVPFTPQPRQPTAAAEAATAAVEKEEARELSRMLSRPVSAPPPPAEDKLVELARARVGSANGESSGEMPPGTGSGKGAAGAPGTGDGGGLLGSGGGGGAGDGLLSSADGRSYYLGVSEKIRRSLRYPSRAQREGLEGRVLVSVRIDREGGLIDCELGESSGTKRLDRDALRTVKRAAPFGAVPESIQGGGLEFDVPVVYALE